MIFLRSVSGLICYVVFSFCRLAISAARFLVVFDNFRICKISRYSIYHRDVTYVKI